MTPQTGYGFVDPSALFRWKNKDVNRTMTKKTDLDAFLSRASARLVWPAVILGGLMVVMMVMVITLKSSFTRFETEFRYRPPSEDGISESPPAVHLAKNQSLYVPVYSHVYIRDGEPFRLTATLSIRNTDSLNPLLVQSVRYYDSEGKLLRRYLEQPLKIAPHATTEFLVEERDTLGGAGANFVVEWASENPLTQPVVEAVMIGASGQQGISFVCPGVVISETRRESAETPTAAGKRATE